MLIKSLRNCFAAKKEFSKFAIPLLLEKFHSNVEEAHLDAIQTFAQCSRETYDPNDYSDYIESLWSFCQKTVLNTSKSELEEAALDAIEAMVFSISRSVQAANFRAGELKPTAVSIDSFTEKAMQNPVKYLNEPDLKLVWPSVKCLHALAKGSSTSNLIVTKRCIPILIEYFNTTTQVINSIIQLSSFMSRLFWWFRFDF
jgi:DNA repair/transcription protein MET18/MMS19